MNIQVMYQNNREGLIDANNLDQMISVNKIKMFMRSDGWAMIGITPTRGQGGMYAGQERRAGRKMMNFSDYKIVA